MRVCYFWTKLWDEAAAALPPGAEMIYVGGSFTDYWEAISARWGVDDLMIVEHDILLHEGVTTQFEECPSQWCVFPYWHDEWLDQALGCTRFRREIQQQVTPVEIQQGSWGSCWQCNPHAALPTIEDLHDLIGWRKRNQEAEILGCWRHIDGKMSWAMRQAGYQPCVHLPTVEHLSRVLPEGEFYVRSWE